MNELKAVVFDWAGTLVDFGSRAPLGVFVEAFRRFQVEITIEEARGPMGLPKLDHIRALGALPRVAEAWRRATGGPFDEAAAGRVYDVFLPLNVSVAAAHAELIPGVRETVAALRAQGLKIGTTTGYTRDIMAEILPRAAEQGLEPDSLVCAGDLPHGRPTPLMMYRCFLDLEVWPASACIKVDDTEPGIAEGVAAGTWTVGVSETGNALGLSADALAALPEAERRLRRERAEALLLAAGADFVVPSVGAFLPVVGAIRERLRRGRKPGEAARRAG